MKSPLTRTGLNILIACGLLIVFPGEAVAQFSLNSPAGSIVWKGGGSTLKLNQSDMNLTDKWYFTVTYPKESYTAQYLHQITTPVFTGITEAGWGLSVVAVGSLHEIEPVANLAHAGRGFSCGHLERISLTSLMDAGDYDYKPPIYSEAGALTEVKQIIDKVTTSHIRADMQTLQDLGTRYYTSSTGLQTPEVVKQMWENDGAGLSQFSVSTYSHGSAFNQKSVVAVIGGTEDDQTTIIIGSHLDSTNPSNQNSAPGADDNASGVAIISEVLRVLAASSATFKRRIEFHAYAAEELGLLGSKDMAAAYKRAGRVIAAMMQIDMAAYSSDPSKNTIYLVNHDSSVSLRRSVKTILTTYLGGDFLEGALPSGATSDHKAWYNQGYPVVFPFEHPTSYNPNIHTSADTLTAANNMTLAGRMASLAVGLVSHYGGLGAAATSFNNSGGNQAPKAGSSDLKLAHIKDGDDYLWAVSTDTSISTVEFCQVSSVADFACQKARKSAEKSGKLGGRYVFFSESVKTKMAANQSWRVFGYDGKGKLLAVRNIGLSQK